MLYILICVQNWDVNFSCRMSIILFCRRFFFTISVFVLSLGLGLGTPEIRSRSWINESWIEVLVCAALTVNPFKRNQKINHVSVHEIKMLILDKKTCVVCFYCRLTVRRQRYTSLRKTAWHTTTWKRTTFAGTLRSFWLTVVACPSFTTARCIYHMILRQTLATCSWLPVSDKLQWTAQLCFNV